MAACAWSPDGLTFHTYVIPLDDCTDTHVVVDRVEFMQLVALRDTAVSSFAGFSPDWASFGAAFSAAFVMVLILYFTALGIGAVLNMIWR